MMSIGEDSKDSNTRTMGKRPGKKPGRKPSKIDEGTKLEKSRQSARECRARKKLRYQYLEELVLNREKAVFALRDEMETYKQWCRQLENGGPVPDAIFKKIASEDIKASTRQIEQVKTAQRHRQELQFSTSASSMSSTSASSMSSTSAERSPSLHLDHSQFRQSQTFQNHSMSTQPQSISLQQQSLLKQPMSGMSAQPQTTSLEPQNNFSAQSQKIISQPYKTASQPHNVISQPQILSNQFRQNSPVHQFRQTSPVHRLQNEFSSLQQKEQLQRLENQQHPHGNQRATAKQLHRQIAFDNPKVHQSQHDQISQQSPSFSQLERTQGGVPLQKTTNEIFAHQQLLSHRNLQQQQQSQPRNNALEQPQHFYENTFSRSFQNSSLPPSKTTSPVKYTRSFEGFQTASNFGNNNSDLSSIIDLKDSGVPTRRRSLSNPDTMNSFNRASVYTTVTDDLPTPLQEFITSHSNPHPGNNESGDFLGLFTGRLLGSNKTSSSSSISSSTIIVEDSNSSDENINQHINTQPSLVAQKRTSSVPIIHENIKHSRMSLTPATLNFDTRIPSTTNVNNLGFTKISNLSATSFGLSSPNIQSLTNSFGHHNGLSTSSTPSLQTASPIPLHSLSSILELCSTTPTSPSTTFSDIICQTTHSTVQQQNFTSFTVPTHIPSTCSTAFLPEHIPDWYSFLADLEDGAISTLTSRQGASSNQNVPIDVTANPPLTSNPTFMNVPNIIDEIFNSDDQLL